MQLILFHHAGGDKYAFQHFVQKMNNEYDIINYELPGRNYRLKESLLSDIEQMTDDAYKIIFPYLKQDYIFIGISMGALLAFLVASKIYQSNGNLPKHIFLSSRKSIEKYADMLQFGYASDELFWNYIKSFGANIDGLLKHQELKDFYEPILRADFKALEYFNTHFQDYLNVRLPIDASSLIGNADPHIDEADAKSWEKYFTKRFETKVFDGGHFFLYNNDDAIEYIRQTVNAY